MNGTQITDFDKLKNTLIEIGVEFHVKWTGGNWKGIFVDSEDATTIFWFDPEDKYKEVVCD